MRGIQNDNNNNKERSAVNETPTRHYNDGNILLYIEMWQIFRLFKCLGYHVSVVKTANVCVKYCRCHYVDLFFLIKPAKKIAI